MAPRPVVGTVAEELYDHLGPWAEQDTADETWGVLHIAEAVGGRLQPVEEIIRDTDDGPGWSAVTDVDRAPSSWLPWTAQLVGVRTRNGLSDLEQRARIKSTDGFKRGSPGAIVGAAQQYLTGTKTVYLTERHGSAYRMTVATEASETPDLAEVIAAVRAQKPAGIILTVSAITGGDYASLHATHSSYDEVEGLYADYAEVLADPTK